MSGTQKNLKGIEEPDEKKDRERTFCKSKKIGYRYSPSSSKKLKDWSLKLLKGDLSPKV